MPVTPDKKRAGEIGRRIAQARKESGGMTQRELAELIGVSDRSVMAYERGDVIPYRFLRKIEEATGRSAGWILHGERYAESTIAGDSTEVLRLILEELVTIRGVLESK